MENVKKSGTGALYSALLLLMSLMFLFGGAEELGYDNLLDYISDYPFTLFFFVLPLIGFTYSAVKRNSWKVVKEWIITKSMKYIFMFSSIIVTTYVIYFILILGSPKTLFQWFSAFVILVSTFVVFLFLRWGEELAKVPIKKERIIKKTKEMFIWFSSIILASASIGALYTLITDIDFPINFFFGYLQSIFCYGALVVAMESRLRNKLRVLAGLIGLPFIIYIFSKIQPELTEYYWTYVIGGTILILGCFFYSLYSKEDTRLKSFIRKMSK